MQLYATGKLFQILIPIYVFTLCAVTACVVVLVVQYVKYLVGTLIICIRGENLARGASVFLTIGCARAIQAVLIALHVLAPAEQVEVSSLWVVKNFHQAVIPKLLAANSQYEHTHHFTILTKYGCSTTEP